MEFEEIDSLYPNSSLAFLKSSRKQNWISISVQHFYWRKWSSWSEFSWYENRRNIFFIQRSRRVFLRIHVEKGVRFPAPYSIFIEGTEVALASFSWQRIWKNKLFIPQFRIVDLAWHDEYFAFTTEILVGNVDE